MSYLDHVLQPPSYGWADANGKLIKPSVVQILKEFFSRLNVVSNRKNWLPFFSWLKVFCLLPFFFIFVFNFLHTPGLFLQPLFIA
jgi:stearoyl-CoA desaturase (delta-9 desaturase)